MGQQTDNGGLEGIRRNKDNRGRREGLGKCTDNRGWTGLEEQTDKWVVGKKERQGKVGGDETRMATERESKKEEYRGGRSTQGRLLKNTLSHRVLQKKEKSSTCKNEQWKDTSNVSMLQRREKDKKRKKSLRMLMNKKQANESDNEANQW